MDLSKEFVANLPEDQQAAVGRLLLDDLARVRKLRKMAAGPLYFLTGSAVGTLVAYVGFTILLNKSPHNGAVILPFVFMFLVFLIFTHAIVFQKRLNAIIELLKIDTATTPSSEFKHSLESAVEIPKPPRDLA